MKPDPTVQAGYRILPFELEQDPGGDWIPLVVRMKLDLLGRKVGLKGWQALSTATRSSLVQMGAENEEQVLEFGRFLAAALAAADQPPPEPLPEKKLERRGAWRAHGPVPECVMEMSARLGRPVPWDRLNRFGRYVLWALADKGAEDRFVRAAEAFGL